MNNLVLIHVPSVTFSSEKVNGKTIYCGVHEFTAQVGERLRSHLSESGVECSAVKRSFKPGGSGFTANSPSGQYFIVVCAEREALPGADISIWADPRGDAVRSWILFELLFRPAVESLFADCPRKWMTIDEYVKSGPPVS